MNTHVNDSAAIYQQGAKSVKQHGNPSLLEVGLLAVALVVMYFPTYLKLSHDVWSQDGQGHGPVMLALSGWLIWKRLPALSALPYQSKAIQATLIFLFSLLLYMFGKSQDFPEFETASQITLLISFLLYYKGWAGVKIMAFPLFFMIFLVPMPPSLVMTVTAPLKAGVSYVSEAILYHAGYPIGRTGVTLSIGSYQLLVADACAGLNSIFALEAIGIFYLSVVEYTNNWRKVLLAILILPISFVSNVIRVMILVLVTYYYGDEAGQGFVHGFAGILLFMVATALTIGTDSLLGLFISPHKKVRA